MIFICSNTDNEWLKWWDVVIEKDYRNRIICYDKVVTYGDKVGTIQCYHQESSLSLAPFFGFIVPCFQGPLVYSILWFKFVSSTRASKTRNLSQSWLRYASSRIIFKYMAVVDHYMDWTAGHREAYNACNIPKVYHATTNRRRCNNKNYIKNENEESQVRRLDNPLLIWNGSICNLNFAHLDN